MHLAILCLHLIIALLALSFGLLTMVVSTPFVLLWPRADKSETYCKAICRRYGIALRPWFLLTEIASAFM